MIKKTIASVLSVHPNKYLRILVGRARSIPTQTSPAERVCLYRATASSFRTGYTIEVGSYLGASSVVIAEALRKRANSEQSPKLFCVDTWQNSAMSEGKRDTWAVFQQNITDWSSYIQPIRANSREAELPDVECDLVFIDGDHTYEGCKADVERYSPCIRDGGRLAMHDHAYYSGVTKVVGEILSSGDWFVCAMVENLIVLQKDTARKYRHVAREAGE